jgi:hypothetical protein
MRIVPSDISLISNQSEIDVASDPNFPCAFRVCGYLACSTGNHAFTEHSVDMANHRTFVVGSR